jgi:hypothetical protein
MSPLALPLLGVLEGLIDRLWPDPQKAAEAKLEMYKLEKSGELAQIMGQLEINKEEAKSHSLFVAGWRPFVGWVCASALAFQFILAPVVQWALVIYGNPIDLPPLDTGTLISLLMALLGVGGLRTIEKLNGVAAK